MRRRIACLSLLAALVGCQRKPPTAPAAAQQTDAVDKTEAVDPDRAELVLQPLPPWTPQDVPRKLNIQLIGEQSKILIGSKFRYRLEIQNVGRDTVVFKEAAPSFIKDGSLCGSSGFSVSVISAGGKEQAMPCGPSSPAGAGSSLDLTLKSGEYLLTRPARSVRDLRTSFPFDKTGAYRIKAVYDVPGLRAESNTVVFEVLKHIKPGNVPDKLAPKQSGTAPATEKKHE